MERAGYMKKTLTIICAILFASMPSYAENYQFVQSNDGIMYKTYNTAKKETKDIFQNPSEKETDEAAENNEAEKNTDAYVYRVRGNEAEARARARGQGAGYAR